MKIFLSKAFKLNVRWLFLIAALAQLPFQNVQAIPLFARQVQQNCVSCHVGGQYPELTPYGRYFKLTGYTQGTSQWRLDGESIPLAMSLQAGMNKMQNNKNAWDNLTDPNTNQPIPLGSPIDARNGKFAPDQTSLYTGGRLADNVGAFAQYSFAWDQGDSKHGTFGADNFDLRYADHIVNSKMDLIYGLSLNNNPGVTDVFNSNPAWAYPFQYSASGSATAPPNQTNLESGFGGGTTRGINVYFYLKKSYYGELGLYSKNPGWSKILTFSGSSNGTADLRGQNPYIRLAYTTEWGPSNFMVGALGMRSQIGDGMNDGQQTTFTDKGLDAQYQYLTDPHVVSAQVRYLNEKISDPSGLLYTNPNNTMNSFYAKAMYVYRAKYGAGLAYWSEHGSPDSMAYNSDPSQIAGGYNSSGALISANANMVSASNSPNTSVWIPGIFWQPLQNVRITLYKTFFTQFLGARNNYDGNGRNASANNSTYLYLWTAY